ncbi:hypothetical protein ACWDYH_35750 [Nocardia goodfellowii]
MIERDNLSDPDEEMGLSDPVAEELVDELLTLRDGEQEWDYE